MSDFKRIERMIREAHVQRSAAIGFAIGDFLGESWLAAAAATRKVVESLRGPKARTTRANKALAAR